MALFLYVTILAVFTVTAKTSSLENKEVSEVSEVSLCYNLTSTTDSLDYVIVNKVNCNGGNVSFKFLSKELFSITELLKYVFYSKSFVKACPAFCDVTLDNTTTNPRATSSVSPTSSPQNKSLNTSLTVVLECNPTSSKQPTIVTSPNYPDKYKNEISYNVTVLAERGYVIRLTFEVFNIEEGIGGCMYDSVQVYDGASTTASNLTEKLCGREIPPPVTSTDNIMHIHFQTDYSVRRRGFQAVADCI